MTPDEFARVTQTIIARDGFASWLPTACYPERCHLAVLVGAPDGQLESACLEWAASLAQEYEGFLVAFRIDDSHFKVVRCAGETRDESIYLVGGA